MSVIGLTEVENNLLAPHNMGREPQSAFGLYSDSNRSVTFDSVICVEVEKENDDPWLSHSASTAFHSESNIPRKISPSLYRDPQSSPIVTKRTLRDPLVYPFNSEYLSFLARVLSMYFRVNISIDETFHTLKSNDSSTEWSSKDSKTKCF